MASAIRSAAVIGTGVIGASWTALFVSRGIRVIATDPASGAEKKLRNFVTESLAILGGDVDAAQKSITFAVNLEGKDHLSEVDFVQENGPEQLAYKESIFSLLEKRVPKHAILASSSSGLPSSKFLGKMVGQGERVIIGHPFNPPHLIPLVEVVPHPQTAPETIDATMQFYTSLGKLPIHVRRECPGFIANRLQAALVHEAYSLVSRGFVTSEDLDKAVSNSIALRWALQGPFLTKVLGGGGGKEGFRHHLLHVGKAAQAWAKDMAENAYCPTEEANAVLASQVDSQLDALGPQGIENLAAVRDRFLQRVAEVKSAL